MKATNLQLFHMAKPERFLASPTSHHRHNDVYFNNPLAGTSYTLLIKEEAITFNNVIAAREKEF